MQIEIRTPLKFRKSKSLSMPEVVKLTDGTFFFTRQLLNLFGSSKQHIDCRTVNGQMLAYSNCAPLNSIISKQADALNNGILAIEDDKGNDKLSALPKNIQTLFTRPNPLQSWPEFLATAYTMLKVFGRAYVMPFKPMGFDNSTATALWVIPNPLVTDELTGKAYGQQTYADIVRGYRVTGFSSIIPPSDMIVLRDTSISVSMDLQYSLFPQSRVYAIGDQVDSIIAAYEARNVLIRKRGALGFIGKDPGSNNVTGDMPLMPKDKEQVVKDFQEQYGLGRDQLQYVISGAALKWNPMTLSTKDLMLFEEVEDSVREIANAFGYPMHLLGFTKGTTYANVAEARKALYENQIIPDSINIAESLSEGLNLSRYNAEINFYFDHLEIFQASKKEEADALASVANSVNTLFTSKILSLDEVRMILAEYIPGESFDPETVNGEITTETTNGSQAGN